MARVLITGGAGELGRALIPLLQAGGYPLRGLGRRAAPPAPGMEWAQVDLASGAGLAQALRGVETVVHAASNPFQNTHETDVAGTGRLLEAARASGVQHLVYISIVGCDQIAFDYYRAKTQAEALVRAGGVPWTILRATQFHSLIDGLLTRLDRLPLVLAVPTARFQPIDTGEAAARLAELVATGPVGRAPDIGGPEVWRLPDMARAWLAARGLRRAALGFPMPGAFASALREGRNTCPSQRYGRVGWREWLGERYGLAAPAETIAG